MIKSTGALLLFAALSAGQAMASDVAFRGNLSSGWKTAMQQQLAKL